MKFGKEPKDYAALVGRCVNVEQIQAHLETLNNQYKDEGYVTTRVYIPEQDLSLGTLKLIVIPGKLERFEYVDGSQADKRIAAAFPLSTGDVINLRSLEQGLENFNSVNSQQAKFKLYPGSEPGQSVVKIDLQSSKPWHLEFKFDNSGFPTTGRERVTFATAFDNLLNINDRIKLNVNSAAFTNRDEKLSDSYDVSYSFPYKNFYFFSGVGYSKYKVTVDGVNQDFILDGQSKYFSLGTEYLIYRNQSSKYYGYSTLKLNRSKSFFDNNEVISQRRELTVASLGLRAKHYISSATIDWNLGVKLRAFLVTKLMMLLPR